jgi:hypothetical protein
MVDMAEQRVLRMAREADKVFCDCGGRLQPVKRGGAVVEGVARCRRCGRDALISRSRVPAPAPEVPEAPEAPVPVPEAA